MNAREAKRIACEIVVARIDDALEDRSLFPQCAAGGVVPDYERIMVALEDLRREMCRRSTGGKQKTSAERHAVADEAVQP